MRRIILGCFLIIIFSDGVHAQKRSNQKKNEAVLFSAGPAEVSAGEFIHIYKKNHINPAVDYTEAAINNYLDLFIKFKLKVSDAKALGMDTLPEFVKEFATYKEELKRPYMADASLLDQLVLEAYERYKTEINASHILVSVTPDATPADTLLAYNKITNIRGRAMSGEDFAALASTLSDDPSAKYNFGNLGWFSSMQMVYPFESAAYQTETGQISNIVKTRFGYHIIKVHERRKAQGEIEVAHIMIRTGPDKDSIKTAQLVYEVYNQLQAEASWDELCSKFSDDVNTKGSGGKFRPFRAGAFASVPEFEEAAFSLSSPGTYTKPFTSAFGWHIIKLINQIPVPEFEQLEPSLKNRISRDERLGISRMRLIEKLKGEYGYKENESVKNTALQQADSSLNRAIWSRTHANAQEMNIASFKNTEVKLSSFYSYVKTKQQPNTIDPALYMNLLYDNFIEEWVMSMEEQRLIRENKEFALLLKEYEEGLLLFEIMEKKVWNRAVDDSIGLRAYYESNSLAYQWGQRTSATIYSHGSIEILNELEELLSDEKTAASFIEEKKIKKVVGQFDSGQSELIDQLTKRVGKQYHQENNLHYLIVIDGILSPSQKTFEEAKVDLISDYQEYLEAQWIDQLRSKYPVRVNEKSKKYVHSVLQQ